MVGEVGTTTAFSAIDYLQLARFGMRTLRIIVEGLGELQVVEGQLYAAKDDLGDGFDALMRILIGGGMGPARARCVDELALVSTNLDIGVEEAILEAARRLDEGAGPVVLGEHDLTFVWDFDVESPPDVADELEHFDAVERGIEALLDGEYHAAREAFRQAQTKGTQLGLVQANLARLDQILGT